MIVPAFFYSYELHLVINIMILIIDTLDPHDRLPATVE